MRLQKYPCWPMCKQGLGLPKRQLTYTFIAHLTPLRQQQWPELDNSRFPTSDSSHYVSLPMQSKGQDCSQFSQPGKNVNVYPKRRIRWHHRHQHLFVRWWPGVLYIWMELVSVLCIGYNSVNWPKKANKQLILTLRLWKFGQGVFASWQPLEFDESAVAYCM